MYVSPFCAPVRERTQGVENKMEQIITADYSQAVKAIKHAIVVCRYRAARQMNGEVLGLYYSIGKYISEQSRNAQWGTNAIQAISDQLQQELPGIKGFSETNIKRMRLFYEAWAPVFENRSAVPAEFQKITQSNDIQPFTFRPAAPADFTEDNLKAFMTISFTHHYSIFSKAKAIDERWFYIRKCAQEFWGYRRLEQALREDLYHTAGSMPNNFALTLPDDKQRAIAMQTFKEDNVLDFLHIEDPDYVDEHDVEQQIVNNVRKFMMSLGNDFAFMGNQYRLLVNGKERFVDLLFYHRRMRCLVAIELKNGEFQPEYAGKLNYYLTALDELVRLPEENQSVGILLCRNKDNAEVEFALGDISKPMGVATYHSVEELPSTYQALPSAEELKKLL